MASHQPLADAQDAHRARWSSIPCREPSTLQLARNVAFGAVEIDATLERVARPRFAHSPAPSGPSTAGTSPAGTSRWTLQGSVQKCGVASRRRSTPKGDALSVKNRTPTIVREFAPDECAVTPRVAVRLPKTVTWGLSRRIGASSLCRRGRAEPVPWIRR